MRRGVMSRMSAREEVSESLWRAAGGGAGNKPGAARAEEILVEWKEYFEVGDSGRDTITSSSSVSISIIISSSTTVVVVRSTSEVIVGSTSM